MDERTLKDLAKRISRLEEQALHLRMNSSGQPILRARGTEVGLGGSGIESDPVASAALTGHEAEDRTDNVHGMGTELGAIDTALAGKQPLIVPAARVTHNANQTILDSTLTVLAFNTEDYDTAALHDTATNNSRLTAPVAGIYQIGANHEWNASTVGFREIQFLKNGATVIERDFRDPMSTGRTTHPLSVQALLAAGDYVEVRVRQTSGASLDSRTATGIPNFYMSYLGET